MTTNQTSSIRFSIEESVCFKKGQEVLDLLGMSLDPEISVHEHEDYISIKGALVLSGEYRPHVADGNDQEDSGFRETSFYRTIDEVTEAEDGIYRMKHNFPIDITIPTNRIQSLEDVYILIESFDYEIPELGKLQLKADLCIGGIINDREVKKEKQEAVEAISETREDQQLTEIEQVPSLQEERSEQIVNQQLVEERPIESQKNSSDEKISQIVQQNEEEILVRNASEPSQDEANEQQVSTRRKIVDRLSNQDEEKEKLFQNQGENPLENLPLKEEKAVKLDHDPKGETENKFVSPFANLYRISKIENDESDDTIENEVPSFSTEVRKEPSVLSNDESNVVAFSKKARSNNKEQQTVQLAAKEEETGEVREKEIEKANKADGHLTPSIEMKGRSEQKNNEWSAKSFYSPSPPVTAASELEPAPQSRDEAEEINTDAEAEKKSKRTENALYLTKLFSSEGEEQFAKLKIRIVQNGETLGSIAKEYDVSATQLIRINGLDDDVLQEGQLLYIPVYAVAEK